MKKSILNTMNDEVTPFIPCFDAETAIFVVLSVFIIALALMVRVHSDVIKDS